MDEVAADRYVPGLCERLNAAATASERGDQPVEVSPETRPLPRSLPLRGLAVGVMIIGASACLMLGLTMPVIELTYFYVWTDTHSFLSITRALYAENELFLAGILVTFSMLFPAIKLVFLLIAYADMAAGRDTRQRALDRVSWLGKWSMLDVLVLVIFYVKASVFSEAAALPGIYFFSGAVVMTMLAYALVEQHDPGLGDA